MKKTAITYWLIPAEPAHSFFEKTIEDLAGRYDAPVFEPHMTIYVGPDRLSVAEELIAKAAAYCGRLEAKMLGIGHSGEFTKTLFVQFALNAKLIRLNEVIRHTTRGSTDYQFKPHVSLLYKKMPVTSRRALADSIKLPFTRVVFHSIKAVRCILPTRSRGHVEAWCVVAAASLAAQFDRRLTQTPYSSMSR